MEMGRALLPAPSLYPTSYGTSTPPLLGGDRRLAGRLSSGVVGDEVGDGICARDAVGRRHVRMVRSLAVPEAPEVADDRSARGERRGLEEDRRVDRDRAGGGRRAGRLASDLDDEAAGWRRGPTLREEPRLGRAQLDGDGAVERGLGVGADRAGT